MLSYMIIGILSYILGIISVIIFSTIKVSSIYNRIGKKEDFGQIAYNEIEKRENLNNKNI